MIKDAKTKVPALPEGAVREAFITIVCQNTKTRGDGANQPNGFSSTPPPEPP